MTRQDRLLYPLEYLQRVQHQSGGQITGNESETCTIIWDMLVNTKKEINRPDIIIKAEKMLTR